MGIVFEEKEHQRPVGEKSTMVANANEQTKPDLLHSSVYVQIEIVLAALEVAEGCRSVGLIRETGRVCGLDALKGGDG
jgi:hypothetical protein